MSTAPYLHSILDRFRQLREQAGISQSKLEEKLILGPGWVNRFEQGKTVPRLDMLLVLLHAIGKDFASLIVDIEPHYHETTETSRNLFATQTGKDLQIHFPYGMYDAVYKLENATMKQFEKVVKTLRDGLSKLVNNDSSNNHEAIKTDSVTRAFLLAVKTWPQANPSDLWWFLIYRAYCDPFNHPADYARLDFTQSWKRTGGWALEEVLARHYGPFLMKHGIELIIASMDVKEQFLKTAKVNERLEPDKIDVLLIGEKKHKKHFFGVIHVKASFAERRTDDVPMSKALVDAGYISPLWTMDCKSMPSEIPINKGELGINLEPENDRRSAKRKDIEDDGYFSACFSYNLNTKPTPSDQNAKARVYVCNFNNADDDFSRFIISSWHRIRKSK